MIKAIVYVSETGFTKKYAEMLGEATGLPVYERRAAAAALKKGDPVVYLGWLMAGKISGYSAAAKRYSVKALAAVGMAPSDDARQNADVKKAYADQNIPVFVMQGGFCMERLHGIHRFMMKTMQRTVGKSLAAKAERTPDEDDMLDMLQNGRDCVSMSDLQPLLDWCSNNK